MSEHHPVEGSSCPPVHDEPRTALAGRHALLAGTSILAGILLAVNAFFPVIVVTPRSVATGSYVIAALGVAGAAPWLVRRSRLPVRLCISLLAVIVTVTALLVGAATLLFRDMDVLARVDVPGWGVMVTYRVDAGAASSSWRWTRKERQLLPGLLLVSPPSIEACSSAGARCRPEPTLAGGAVNGGGATRVSSD